MSIFGSPNFGPLALQGADLNGVASGSMHIAAYDATGSAAGSDTSFTDGHASGIQVAAFAGDIAAGSPFTGPIALQAVMSNHFSTIDTRTYARLNR